MPSTFTSTSEMSWGVNLREGQKLKTQNVARDNCYNGFLNVNAFVQKQQFREFKKDKGDPSKLSLKQGDYKIHTYTHDLLTTSTIWNKYGLFCTDKNCIGSFC